MNESPAFKRILLKLSGEALSGQSSMGIDPSFMQRIAKDVARIISLGVQVAIVIGAGNFCRGSQLSASGVDRVTADHMGMLATMMNGLALRDAFEKQGLQSDVFSAIFVQGIMSHFDRRKAIASLEAGNIIILAGGTGNPLVTTDSAAALRAIEVKAEIILKATKVDGIFDSDPIKNPKAKRFDTLSFQQAIKLGLQVMDLQSIVTCCDYALPIRVFNMNQADALYKIMLGETVGTLVHPE
jgi:uridylate kinase